MKGKKRAKFNRKPCKIIHSKEGGENKGEEEVREH
jgi:hypothetical protein